MIESIAITCNFCGYEDNLTFEEIRANGWIVATSDNRTDIDFGLGNPAVCSDCGKFIARESEKGRKEKK